MQNLTEQDIEMKTEAPWKQEVNYGTLLETFINHEYAHTGQIYFILTYYRGPPEFTDKWTA
jgi:uncharacterized damage-inducible protein DinB